jgi:hypothetical protein
MPARYFFGKSVKSSYVIPSTARSFEELVKKHLETDYPLAITRDAYHALESRKDKLNAKDSPYLTACTFKDEFITDDGVTRVAEHSTGLCNLIFLDIDVPRDAAPLVSRPETMRRALGAWNFAAYTTASTSDNEVFDFKRAADEAEHLPDHRSPHRAAHPSEIAAHVSLLR